MILRTRFVAFFVAEALSAAGCARSHDDPTLAPLPRAVVVSPSPSPSAAAGVTAAAGASAPAPATTDARVASALMPDAEVGPFLARLSESPGDFPSDNYVTNETSLLDVAPALRDAKLRGRAYVGVGPEQSFTYLAMLEPQVAYIVDIRRGNFLEHMFYRGCFEEGLTRAGFLSALLARQPSMPGPDGGAAVTSSFASIEAAFLAQPADRALRDSGLQRTRALLERLHVVHQSGDEEELARIHDAFFTRGLALAYSMKGSQRKYPTLAETFAGRDAQGVPASFLATEESYARVRQLVLENRVLPIVGDFGGRHALTAVAADMRARGLLLGAFYTSNVEQYLFDAHTYGSFVASVTAMPRDDASLLVRVWFDQGRAHPAQRPGHRTTQISIPANVFLAKSEKASFRSYWDVVNQPAAAP